MSKLDEFVKDHKFGCAFGWGSKSERNDPAFIARWCDCGQLNAAAELAQLRAALEEAKAIITNANIDNQMSVGEGCGTWSVTGFFQKR